MSPCPYIPMLHAPMPLCPPYFPPYLCFGSSLSNHDVSSRLTLSTLPTSIPSLPQKHHKTRTSKDPSYPRRCRTNSPASATIGQLQDLAMRVVVLRTLHLWEAFKTGVRIGGIRLFGSTYRKFIRQKGTDFAATGLLVPQ